MISDSAAPVLFAIRSSIKLGLELRQAVVDSTKRRDLVLPLPNFASAVDIVSAANYFAAPPGSDHAKQTPLLTKLLAKRQNPGQNLSPDEETQVLTYYLVEPVSRIEMDFRFTNSRMPYRPNSRP